MLGMGEPGDGTLPFLLTILSAHSVTVYSWIQKASDIPQPQKAQGPTGKMGFYKTFNAKESLRWWL